MKQSPHTENSLAFSLKRFHPQKQKSSKISPGKHCKWTKWFLPKASPSLSQERTPRIHTPYKKRKKKSYSKEQPCVYYIQLAITSRKEWQIWKANTRFYCSLHIKLAYKTSKHNNIRFQTLKKKKKDKSNHTDILKSMYSSDPES